MNETNFNEAGADESREAAAVPVERCVMKWQPIDTAPKGTFIVASPRGGVWGVQVAYRAKNGTIRSETGVHEITDATHWMPFPDPPYTL